MLRALKIEIGSVSFTHKEISKVMIEKAAMDLLVTLGIRIDVDVTLTDNNNFLTINGCCCHFPDSLTKEVDEYLLFLEKSNKAVPNDDLYWELVVSNIIWLQPHVLFPDECLPDYMPALLSLPGNNFKAVEKKCKEIIVELLNLRISLAERSLIAEISNKYLNNPVIEWNEFREELIASLVSPEIAVFFNRDYFDQVITTPNDNNLFEMMRDGLFYETGIKYPPFKIIFDDHLPYNAYCFKINNYTSIPQIGLTGKDEILVNDTPYRLSLLGITGRETLNPANGNKASLINANDKQKAESGGLTTWDGSGYFILSFSAFLRRYGYLFIDKKFALQYLELLKLIYPKINELIAKERLLPVCVKTLRLLSKEEISIRNLHVILEAILESDYILSDGQKNIIFDERIPVRPEEIIDWKYKAENVTEFVRIRLKKYISHKYSRGQSTLMVYLLDPEIETMACGDLDPLINPGNETLLRIQKAVENEIENLAPSTQVPVILTTVNVRIQIKKIIEKRFPKVAVLSYQELSPAMNIQPIGRISLD